MADPPAHGQVNLAGSATPKKARQNPQFPAGYIPHLHQESDGLPLTSPVPRIAAVHQARSSKILNRISFAQSKGIKDRAMEELETRRQGEKRAEAKARKEAAAQERKARREQEHKKREAKRQESRDRAEQNKKDKAERKAEEKRVQDYYGIRGYDPSAGMLRSSRERAASQTTDGQSQTCQNNDERPRPSQTWGLEYGKPEEDRGNGRHSTL